MNRKLTIYIFVIVSIFLGTSEVSPKNNRTNEENSSQGSPSRSSNAESLLGYWKCEFVDSISRKTVIYDFTGDEALIIYQSNQNLQANQIKTDSKIYKYLYDSFKQYFIYYSYDSKTGEYNWNLWKVIKFNGNILTIANIDSGDEPIIDSYKCQQIIDYYKENEISYDNDDIQNFIKINDTDFNSWWNSISERH